MLPWGRTSSSSSSLPTLSSSRNDVQLANDSAPTSPRAKFGRRADSSTNKMQKLQEAAQAVVRDDDVWDEGSDDESTKQQLQDQTTRLSHLSMGSLGSVKDQQTYPAGPGGSADATATPSRAGSTTTASPSSWFNPFNMISSLSSPTSTTSSHTNVPMQQQREPRSPQRESPRDGVNTSLNKGGSIGSLSQTKPPTRGTSYLATANRVQEEADKVVDQEEQAKLESGQAVATTESRSSISGNTEAQQTQASVSSDGRQQRTSVDDEGEPHERAKKSSAHHLEQCRLAIKAEVHCIVEGRLEVNPTRATPGTEAERTEDGHRRSISSVSAVSMTDRKGKQKRTDEDDHNDDDDELDPAAGYVQLDATNLSSTGPEIVDYNQQQEREETAEECRDRRRRTKFFECLQASNIDLGELRSLAWSGIPQDLRPVAWQLLLGYLPAPASRRISTLARKRQEYADAVRLAFSRGVKGLDGPIWHQISIDVPRTNAGVRLWQGEGTQRSLERILYVWAIRHPASGYVQGINDLVTPFFQVFLSSYIDSDPEEYDVSALPPPVLEALEADSFWCLSKLLDGIQDNYIFAQPGITRQVARMKELCSRVDAPLANHLEDNGVEFIQFAFRWMNCLLMREMNVKNIIRMWDTYLAEGGDAFSEFHLYVCLAFLVRWSDQLRDMDFQSIIMFLQALPTQGWTDKDIELLLSESFMWSRVFKAR
ncbi:GTPase-activating protein [Microbotryomycetes sp. JL221]|nr:GTPase-activating protein [Microbotryomycetes sp. JL221]